MCLEIKQQSDWQARARILIGDTGVDTLKHTHVVVAGLGGVGSHCAEALARAGVGKLTLIDCDTVSLTNLNRQLVALRSNLGMPKAEAMGARMLDINPQVNVTAINEFYLPDNRDMVELSHYDYVLDAVDMVPAKLMLAEKCAELGIPIISSMGTGNKLDPTAFTICDISETHNCPLARKMRKELKRRGVTRLTVVFSPEDPVAAGDGEGKVGSIAFVPGAAGLMLAGKAIRDIAEGKV